MKDKLHTRDIRPAIYSRISLDRTGLEEGVERQEEACRKIAEDAGWPDPKVYRDNSISAYNTRKKRPDYDRLVHDVETGAINAVIVWDIDRLTRQPRQLADWLDYATTLNCLLIEAKGGDMAMDLRRPNDRLMLRIRADFAAYEVEHKGERQAFANRQRALQGKLFMGVRPMGYTTEAEIIDDEAEAVRAIYDAFLAGASLKSIARALSGDPDELTAEVPTMPRPSHTKAKEFNERHPDREPRPVPTPGPWDSGSVLKILRNPRYAGLMSYTPSRHLAKNKGGDGTAKWWGTILTDEDGNPIHAAWEPILDEGVWWSVQRKLDDAARRMKATPPKVRKHLGSGIYRCGVCGGTLHINGGHKGAGSYTCKQKGHVCSLTSKVDPLVSAVIEAVLDRPDIKSAVRVRPNEKKAPDTREEEARQQRRIERAERDYADELIEAVDLKRIRDEAREIIRKLKDERESAESSHAAVPANITDAPSPAEAFRNAPLATRRAVLDYLCTVTIMPRTNPMGGATDGKPGNRFDPSRVVFAWKTGAVPPENSGTK